MAMWTDSRALRYGARSGTRNGLILKGYLWPLLISAGSPIVWATLLGWREMSPAEFVCVFSCALFPTGFALIFHPRSAVRIIGHCLYIIGFGGIIYSASKILSITFPVPRIRFGRFRFIEWVLVGGAAGLAYAYRIDRTLAEQLEDQADAVKDFSSRIKQGTPVLLSFDKPLWRKIARDYYRECGKRALRLLRRSADPNFKSNYKAIATPDQYRDFFTIEMYLRATARGVRYHWVRRTIRYVSFGIGIAIAIFCGTWIAMHSGVLYNK